MRLPGMFNSKPATGKVAQLPTHLPTSRGRKPSGVFEDDEEGYLVNISSEDLDRTNYRILSSSEKPPVTPFFVPRKIPMQLISLRSIFTELQRQTNSVMHDDVRAERLPLEAFQRVFERLFFLLNDPLGFDAKVYDDNGDGMVTWGEFFHVYRRRDIVIRLSWCERIYLTFDSPDSSILSQIVSAAMLLVILFSSGSFIFSTLPTLQIHYDDGRPPTPGNEFVRAEEFCLIVFIFEYVTRLLTCWGIRPEILNHDRLMEQVVSFEPLKSQHSLGKFISFLLAPSNLIDFAAILPGIVSFFVGKIDGGAFVVLRLIRLTRIFRAFKNPALVEPVIVIGRTIQKSTKALYVLFFNLLLGIIIFGSLMFLAEGGTWDANQRSYVRPTSRTFNETSREWQTNSEISPFESIPASFWWAIVTASTVGYGDHVPKTELGYLIAILMMFFSLVILSLPVGVIGGTFSSVWSDFDKEKQSRTANRDQQMRFITQAIQKLDPATMSRLMLIEVWHEHPDLPPHLARPEPSCFMGEAALKLELPEDRSVTKQLSLPLEKNSEIAPRCVTGSITIRYQWTPKKKSDDDCTPLQSPTRKSTASSEILEDEIYRLEGSLKVTIISAERLINLDLTRRYGASNPYCMVLVYPTCGDVSVLKPSVWRSPSRYNTLNPKFNCSNTFAFGWHGVFRGDLEQMYAKDSPSLSPKKSLGLGPKQRPAEKEAKPVAEVAELMKELANEVKAVKKEVRSLSNRLDSID